MRVVIVSPLQRGHGGGERVVAEVVRQLTRRGHDVTLALEGPSPTPGWYDGLPVVTVGPVVDIPHGRRRVATRLIKWYYERVASADFDVVVALDVWSIAILKVLAADVPVVSWLHAVPPLNTLYRFMLSEADGHMAISAGMHNILNTMNIQHVRTVHNPVDIEDIASLFNPLTRRLIYVGRLSEEKCVEDILYAMAAAGTWSLDVFGDGVEMPALRKRASELHLCDAIRWWGWVEKPWSLVRDATALVLPSRTEAFGLVVVEAMAHGVPVLASSGVFGARELVIEGVTGWIYTGQRELIKLLRNLDLHSINVRRMHDSVAAFSSPCVVDKIEGFLETTARR